MARGRRKNTSNKNQDIMASQATPKINGYFNSLETQENDFKSTFIQLLEAHKKETNKYLKEIATQLEAFEQETKKSLKEIATQMEINEEEMNKALEETHANIAKQIEALVEAYKEEMNKKIEAVMDREESTFKEMKEMLQDMKTELESVKKTHTKKLLEMENLAKRPATTEVSSMESCHEDTAVRTVEKYKYDEAAI